MSAFTLYKKTFIFTILRVLTHILIIMAGYTQTRKLYIIIKYILDEPNRVPQLARFIFDAAYFTLALSAVWLTCYYIRKVILNYIKAMHIIIMTRIYMEDKVYKSQLANLSLAVKELGKYCIPIHLFFLCDITVNKSLEDLSTFISKQKLPFNLQDSKNIFVGFVNKNVKLTASHCDEIIFSYLYYRARIDIHAEVKFTIKRTLKYSAEGLMFLAKSCLSLLKSTFILALKLQIFQILTTIVFTIILFYLAKLNVRVLFFAIVIYKVIYDIIDQLILQPYHIANSLTIFYEILDNDDNSKEFGISATDEGIKELKELSPTFGKLMDKAGLSQAKKDIKEIKENLDTLDDILEIESTIGKEEKNETV